MASTLKGGRLGLALIILVVLSLSSSHTITTVTARTPYTHVRQLATDCNPLIQQDYPGCGGGGGGGGGSSAPLKRQPCGSTPGSSLCKKGCCGVYKMGQAICC